MKEVSLGSGTAGWGLVTTQADRAADTAGRPPAGREGRAGPLPRQLSGPPGRAPRPGTAALALAGAAAAGRVGPGAEHPRRVPVPLGCDWAGPGSLSGGPGVRGPQRGQRRCPGVAQLRGARSGPAGSHPAKCLRQSSAALRGRDSPVLPDPSPSLRNCQEPRQRPGAAARGPDPSPAASPCPGSLRSAAGRRTSPAAGFLAPSPSPGST